ncbi:hypothetical protein EJ02DRAFT_452710 [Clathrospora elynae]|uniref:GCN5-related N-acetyltransferase Rv2170-like domain-containing protein n=1 Tax=Clathrospora elynae TaxID=706981 RepID=A0A6A5T4V8_9PLEO|nr:hypothetical protein EJ02DRAFT_452710 [Clathrospora elynae]
MEVYEHPTSSPTLQAALKSALPYSINLTYRTQHPNRTPDAHILATFPSSTSSLPSSTHEIPQCWAAAYLDRSMRPETELWIFSTGEQPHHSGSQDFCPGCRKAVLSLLDYMSTVPVPPLHPDNLSAIELAKQHAKDHPTPPPSGNYELSPGTYMRHLLLPKVVTLGACHHAVVQICRQVGVLRNEFPGSDNELNKFLFKISDLPEVRELPEGLRWGEMREQDIDTVKARTSIPRSTKTLLSLKSVGVFEKATDTAVAWTFLGLDGSLTTLYTEEAYRGKGIAKAVAAKIFRQYAPGLAVDGDGNAWSHGDVYLGNVQSESVCRSLGGNAMWRCFWVRIDLERAGTLAMTA